MGFMSPGAILIMNMNIINVQNAENLPSSIQCHMAGVHPAIRQRGRIIMTISLEKLNQMYNQVAGMKDTLKHLEEQFREDTGCEEYQNPFDRLDNFEAIIRELKQRLEFFLMRRYNETFCPNISVSGHCQDHDGWFEEFEFDAVEFVNRINERILANPEKLAYEQMLDEARGVLECHRYVEKATMKEAVLKSVKGKVFRGHCYPMKTRGYPAEIDYGTDRKVAAFEKFVRLILDNQSLYSRVAPTQLQVHTPIGNSLWIDKELPQTVLYGGKYIEKAVFFKNGRIDFHFDTAANCKKVALALAGDPPDVPFPEEEIDANKLFQFHPEMPKRVVNRG